MRCNEAASGVITGCVAQKLRSKISKGVPFAGVFGTMKESWFPDETETQVGWPRLPRDSHCLIDRKPALHLHTSLDSTHQYPQPNEKQSFLPIESS